MAVVTEPTFDEIKHVAGLANSYLEGIAAEDDDQPTDWEWDAVAKINDWANAIESLDKESQIALAMETLKKLGVEAVAMKVADAQHLETCLTISTAHVSVETAMALNDDKFGLIAYDKGDYGWWFFINDLPADMAPVPSDLRLLLERAQSLNCVWLCLDQAADCLDDLPTYEW